MELEHSFTVPVPMERAWDVLLDVERVAPCMPGATLDSVTGDDIAGRIKVKVGPITMTYAGNAKFTERDKSAGVVKLEASGKETRGAGTASASVRSELSGDGDSTHVTVHTSLNVTGKPAQFGRGVMNEVGGKLIGIFADNLAAMLAAEPAAGTEASEEPAGTEAGEEPADADDEANSAGSEPSAVAESAAASPDEALPIDVLNLPTRAWSSLRRDGVQTLGDLVRRTPEQLLAIENIGPASVAEISRRLQDRGLALTESAEGSAAADAGTAVPPARPAGDDAPGGPAPSYQDAAERSAANGGAPAQPAAAPREPVRWQPRDEAIDLLGVAGLPVLKRAVPAVAGFLALILVVFGIRRRRARR
jgi:carbon monoxide dehydrogenase subunit G